MKKIQLNIEDNKELKSYDEVLEHIYKQHLQSGTVKDSYLAALKEREVNYPTGILLDGYAVAIPHCDVEHANKPAIFIMRLSNPIEVDRADEDEKLAVQLVINLVVTDPAAQLNLLKSLFRNLQEASFYQNLSSLPINEAKFLFNSTIINQ